MKIYLDPKRATGLSFISHAHSDHCPRSFQGTLIASTTTCALMRKTPVGECWHKATEVGGVGFSLHRSGHIPGSTQLLMENGSKILYTGDLNFRGGLITGAAETPKCDILIIEATFGTPRYSFPDKADVVREMKDWAEECHSRGSVPVLLGYSIGKGQELTKAFSADFTVFVEEGIYQFNKRAEALGIELGDYLRLEGNPIADDIILIIPPHRARGYDKKGYEMAYASGWAVTGGWGRRQNGYRGFPLSDHSDFDDLIEFVEKVSPQAVYTTHGYAEEFSAHLREQGFYSEPLSEVQSKLDGF